MIFNNFYIKYLVYIKIHSKSYKNTKKILLISCIHSYIQYPKWRQHKPNSNTNALFSLDLFFFKFEVERFRYLISNWRPDIISITWYDIGYPKMDWIPDKLWPNLFALVSGWVEKSQSKLWNTFRCFQTPIFSDHHFLAHYDPTYTLNKIIILWKCMVQTITPKPQGVSKGYPPIS